MLTLLQWAESFQPWRKPWLLLGKGPSFDRLPLVDRSDYFICALNHVVREMEVTIAHAIDLDVVVTCAEEIERNARFLVMPFRPHVGFDPGPKTLFDLQDDVPVLGRLARAGRLVCYDLSSSPPSGASPRIEARFFSAEAALELLAVCGAGEVRSLGVDGGTSYSRAFDDLTGTTRLANGRPSFDVQFEQIAAVLRRRSITFAPWGVEAPVRVFVGADPAQRLPAKVLEWSLKRHASVSVVMESIDDACLPAPARPEHRSRTGFSFARFRIPGLCGGRGRALYMDADMLALADVARLWATPLEGASLAYAPQPANRQSVRYSVLLLDCERLAWDAERIVGGLDRGEYRYEELMGELCVVPPEQRRPLLPAAWNSAERVEAGTCLVHFTDMPTQPWVTNTNPHGEVWYAALREALAEGFVSQRLLDEEIALGHVSPQLPAWIGRPGAPGDALRHAGWTPPFVRLSKQKGGAVDHARAVLANVRQSRTWRRLTGKIHDTVSYGDELEAAAEVRKYPFRREEAKPGFAAVRARLESERGLFLADADGPPLARLVVLLRGEPGPKLERTLRLWELQSCPRRDAVVLARDGKLAAAVRSWAADRDGPLPISVDTAPTAGLDEDAFVVFARPGDRLHPSLVTTLRRVGQEPGADLVAWHGQRPLAAPGGLELLTSPDREPFTLWNTPVPPRAFALRARWARSYPGDLPRAAETAGGQAVLLWASVQPGLRWATHPEFLVAYGAPDKLVPEPAVVAEVKAHLAGCAGVTCAAAPGGGRLPWRVAPEPRPARVSVVIPFRDDLERTRACLTSVLAQTTLVPSELVLVAHRTQARIRQELEQLLAGQGVATERIRWVEYGGPFNHSLQCDLGVRVATGDVLLFLNNDARLLSQGLLQSFVDWALLPGVGTVGCRLVGQSGRLIGAGVRVLPGRPRPWSAPVEESTQTHFADDLRETVANSFACAALARATYDEVGPLDATWFPAGYNDVDYCLRLRRAGRHNVYLGSFSCEHEPGGSRPKTDELPQILELWRRYPELLEVGRRQLSLEVSEPATKLPTVAETKGTLLRTRLLPLRSAAKKFLRGLRRR